MTALISRDDLKASIDAGIVTVVDALGGDYYAKQHLPGAVALAPGQVDAMARRGPAHRIILTGPGRGDGAQPDPPGGRSRVPKSGAKKASEVVHHRA